VLWNFDDDVEIVRKIIARRNLVQTHDASPFREIGKARIVSFDAMKRAAEAALKCDAYARITARARSSEQRC